MPFGDSRSVGMMLPGNGWPVSGIVDDARAGEEPVARVEQLAEVAAAASPLVGTVMSAVCSWKKFTHSCAPKKNSLSLNMPTGIGPPNE